MLNITCNIDKSDRVNRVVFGVLILIATVLNLGKWFFVLLSLVLIVEGIVGWCGIPNLVNRVQDLLGKK